MADLLPSIPDASAPEGAEPRVVGLEDDDAEDVLGALSSTTARELFAAISEDPAHPSALADRVDTTLQNCQYHIAKLEDAGLVEVVDTAYSAKGREMDVYAPADRPLVLFAGDEQDRSLLSRALGRLLGGLGVVAGASVVAQGLFAGEEAPGTAAQWEPEQVTMGGDAVSGEEGRSVEDADGAGGGDEVAADDGGGAGDATGDGDVATDGGDAIADGGAESQAPPEYEDLPVGDVDVQATSDSVVDSVSPVADELAPVGDLLAATGLEPGLAVFLLGSLLLVLAVVVRYRLAAGGPDA